MQLNKNQVVEINLKDLFFHLLYRWRSFLIAALIGAIALCGYQYLSAKIIHDQGKLTKEERQYQINLQQYNEGLESNRNTIRVYTKVLQEQNDYLNNSIYIQLSPQNLWVASSKYLVKPEQETTVGLSQNSVIDPADSILPLYSSPLSQVTDNEKLKEAFGTEKTEYINELVIVNTDVTDNTITLYVLGESRDTVLSGLALLDEQMEAIASSKANTVAPHQLIKVTESISHGLDKEIAEKVDLAQQQENLAKNIKDIQETLQEARQKLDSLETKGGPQEPGMHLLKNIVIGAMIGVAILAVLYTIFYALKGRLRNSHDLTQRYKLPIFGEFSATERHRIGKGLDKLISRWEYGGRSNENETVLNHIAALIAEKRDNQKFLIVSTLASERITDISIALAERIPEKTIDVQTDINHNSEAVTKASKADAVIIAEEKGVSHLKDMDQMVEALLISEANVIGAIIL